MELRRVEEQRSHLVQLLVFLIMLFLGLILVLAWRRADGYAIPALALMSLAACLYVVARERRLRRRHGELVQEVIARERQVSSLGRQLEKTRTGASELESRLRELTGLYRAIRTVNAVEQPEQACETVLRAGLELVGGDCGSVMVLDETRENLVLMACHGLGAEVEPRMTRRLDEGIAGWVVRNDEPLLLRGDLQEDQALGGLLKRQTELEVSICVPLHLGGRVRGVLSLGATPAAEGPRFTELELRHAVLFAQHAAVVIENARLYERLQQWGLESRENIPVQR